MIKRYNLTKDRRTARTRAKVSGSLRDHKLLVFRSNKYIYAQIIETKTGSTLASVRSEKPEEAGKEIAAKAKKLKVEKVVFDRGSYKYHGKVKLLADNAREGGLIF